MKVLIVLILTSFSLWLLSCTGTPAEDTKTKAISENMARDSNLCVQADARFMVKAAEVYLTQIQLAQLARTRSKNREVKNLAEDMENYYTSSLAELTKLAGEKHVTLPESTTKKGEDAYNMLNDQHKKQFDAAYSQVVIDTHQEALDSLSIDSVCDRQVKAWNQRIISGIRHNMNMTVLKQQP